MDDFVSDDYIDAIFLVPHYPKKDGIVGLGGVVFQRKDVFV